MTKAAYDLEERTTLFSESIINLAKTIPKNIITLPLISQLIRSTTSIGANYCEADCAESKKDFIHKIGICKKKLRKLVIGYASLQKQNHLVRKGLELFGKKLMNFILFLLRLLKNQN